MIHTDNKTDHNYMQNRELSWLRFNERVLHEAQDDTVPLYERLKFISIFTSNLDEFFMIRVGSLNDLSLVENAIDGKTGMTPRQQLDKIFEATIPLYELRDNLYNQVNNQLKDYGVSNLEIKDLNKSERKFIEKIYQEDISPILSPQVIDSRHPFPHLSNKSLYLVCEFIGDNTNFGLIPISQSLPPFVCLPGGQARYVLIEDIIAHYSKDILKMYKIESYCVISVTRNADITPEDEMFDMDDDYRESMKKALKKRERLSPVRLEVRGAMSKGLMTFMMNKLHLSKDQIFRCVAPLTMNYVFQLSEFIPATLLKQLSYLSFKPALNKFSNKEESMLNRIKRKDMLLSFPYESMEPFLSLLKESASDPSVISIKITIYRLSKNSRIIDYLCTAAENNKEVIVLMELKARFDERNNIEWAERLEEAGCIVNYGFEGFKVHSKICLITRRERSKIQYITQVGTGNYNEKTAKLYTDLCLMTANAQIGQEANDFFKNMSISNLKGNYNELFVAPYYFKNNLLALIDCEIEKARRGEPSRIIIKSNSLTDKDIIKKLSQASNTGVEIKLLIRGICCLLPGIPGKTENIKVISIVGRFLEHSRIYCFGTGKDIRLYIASADMMTRNMVKRVEIACPILDIDIKNEIVKMLDILFSDTVKARELTTQGMYQFTERRDDKLLDAQHYFLEEAKVSTNSNDKRHLFIRKLMTKVLKT